jgi:limonene-1,2-epoxide hydrolase
MEPAETVGAFIRALEKKEIGAALGLLAEEVVYHNIPLDPVVGRRAVGEFLEAFLGPAQEVEWVVHHQATLGGVVLNERTDRFLLAGRWVEIPVAGVWEVSGGRISHWRDYFDLQMVTAAMAPPAD